MPGVFSSKGGDRIFFNHESAKDAAYVLGRSRCPGQYPPVLPIKVPCRQCLGCRLAHARDWATRSVVESRYHSESCFLTLTYRDDALPAYGSVHPWHIGQFVKRVRDIGRVRVNGKLTSTLKVRYLASSEYGPRTNRPHYHMLLWGYCPSDLRLYKRGKDPSQNLYVSRTLNRLWGHGRVIVGSRVNVQTAGYVARYTLKKANEGKSAFFYTDREKLKDNKRFTRYYVNKKTELPALCEYLRCSKGSRKSGIGGIGYRYFDDRCGKVYVQGGIRLSDRPAYLRPIPKYFDYLMKKRYPDGWIDIAMARVKKMQSSGLLVDLSLDEEDASLRVAELVKQGQTRGLFQRDTC